MNDVFTPNFDRIAREGCFSRIRLGPKQYASAARDAIRPAFLANGTRCYSAGAFWDHSQPSYPLLLGESVSSWQTYKVWSLGCRSMPYGGSRFAYENLVVASISFLST